MTYKIITFGCKVNSYESEFISEQLKKEGYSEVENLSEANIIVVNTCSVTNTADNKCKRVIRSIKRDYSDSILVVCGCSAENKSNEYAIFDIDILLGNKDKSKIAKLIKDYLITKEKYQNFCESRQKVFEDMKIENFNLTRAFVKIQDGCDNFCAFCIIPYVRGSIRSKKFEDAQKEIEELVNKGYREIVLTGINTGAYGKDTKEYDLTDLIHEISKFDKLERIRISSIEITEITDKFINELKNNQKLCGHLHISLQSGSAKTLKRMNRKYTKEEYLQKVKKIKEARPNINLTTDVIVGFPGETDEEYQESVEFCVNVAFSKIHVFPYSIREGTASASMNNQIDNKTKKMRAKELIEIDKKLQYNYNSRFFNQVVSVLIEEVSDNKSIGHTENFLKVIINEKLDKNKDYDILITDIFDEYVIGKRC